MTRLSPARASVAASLAAALFACTAYTGSSLIEPPMPLPTELSATQVLAQAPMQDSARVAGSIVGFVGVLGLFNRTAPCFTLSSTATRSANHVTVILRATEQPGTCATFAAGAFEYDVAVRGLTPDIYEVDVVHRVLFQGGGATETRVASRRVEVR